MTGTFLAGVLSAWAATQLGLGAFFLLAYFLGRREAEYLLFGLLCFALSVSSVGTAIDYSGASITRGLLADKVTLSGAILAAALYVHFAWCFAELRRPRLFVYALYATVAFYELANWNGALWSGPHVVVSHVLGGSVRHALGSASPLGLSFYVVGSLETISAITLLAYAYRSGRREALASLIGATLMLPAIVNDVGLGTGLIKDSIDLLPHGFLVFAFGVAGTLLLRYRLAADELRDTAARLEVRTEQLRSSYAELRSVQIELVMKKQLAAVGELAAAIAHEVRNPLAIIVNAVAGLRRSGPREEDRSMLLGIVDEEVARLNRLVTDLLHFARPVSVQRSPVSLLELANRSRSHAMARHGVVVDVQADPEIQAVWVDPSLFRLVFDNLVENACQAMRGGGTLEISVTHGDLDGIPAVEIAIKDHGHGMEPEVRERALDPFFTTRPSGTGLGLPIVHRIMEAHGGQISIESDEGVGTTVVLLLPIGEPSEAAENSLSDRVA